MFDGVIGSRTVSEEEHIARLIAGATHGDSKDWERYLPAARELLVLYDMGPAGRAAGGLLG